MKPLLVVTQAILFWPLQHCVWSVILKAQDPVVTVSILLTQQLFSWLEVPPNTLIRYMPISLSILKRPLFNFTITCSDKYGELRYPVASKLYVSKGKKQ